MNLLMNNMKRQLLDKYRKAPITSLLIAISVIVYIISFVLYGEEMNVAEGISFGGYNPMLVFYYHEYYRLVTANFIHFGFLHLLMNCYSLYGIGMFIESSLKTKKYLIVCFMSMLATNGLPYLLFLVNGFGVNTINGGISGLIFGLIGALAALAFRYQTIFMQIFKQLFPNVLLMLMISFIIPSISLSGHISGMIGGFITTSVLLHYKPKKKDYHELLN